MCIHDARVGGILLVTDDARRRPHVGCGNQVWWEKKGRGEGEGHTKRNKDKVKAENEPSINS